MRSLLWLFFGLALVAQPVLAGSATEGRTSGQMAWGTVCTLAVLPVVIWISGKRRGG